MNLIMISAIGVPPVKRRREATRSSTSGVSASPRELGSSMKKVLYAATL